MKQDERVSGSAQTLISGVSEQRRSAPDMMWLWSRLSSHRKRLRCFHSFVKRCTLINDALSLPNPPGGLSKTRVKIIAGDVVFFSDVPARGDKNKMNAAEWESDLGAGAAKVEKETLSHR